MLKSISLALGFGLACGSAMAADIVVVPPPLVRPMPAAEKDLIRGDIDVYVGVGRTNWTEPTTEVHNDTVFGGQARVNIPFTKTWNLEVEGLIFSQRISDPSFPTTYSQYAAVAHLYARDPAGFALGVFGGPIWSGFSNSTPSTVMAYLVGAEGQAYLSSQAILYLQAYYKNCHDCVFDTEGYAVRGNFQYFLNPRTSLALDVQYAASTANTLGKSSVLTAAVTGMMQLSNTPFAVFLQGRYDHDPAPLNQVADRWSGLIGLRFVVGPKGTDLWTNATKGPAMNVLPSPGFALLNPR